MQDSSCRSRKGRRSSSSCTPGHLAAPKGQGRGRAPESIGLTAGSKASRPETARVGSRSSSIGNSCKQQETTNEEHTKQKEEAIAAEAAGIEKANSLKEQLAQAKGKLEAARLEQAPVEASTTSARRVIVPRAEETQDEFAQRRLELAQLSLPPSKQPNDVAQREMLEEYRKIYADMQAQGKLALAATPAPKQAPAGQKRDREPDTADGEGDADMADPTADDLDDDLLDCFHAMQNSGGGDDVAEDPQAAAARRLEQRKQFQAAATKGGLTKVFHLKGKRAVAAQA